jgi:hypothetical protein
MGSAKIEQKHLGPFSRVPRLRTLAIEKASRKQPEGIRIKLRPVRKRFSPSHLPRMDSNHDKVIQSHFRRCSVVCRKEPSCAG